MNKNKLLTGEKERVSILIDKEMLEIIDKDAVKNDRTRSSTIRNILFKHFSAKK